ncbi:MAG: LytTR family DNA-binding domain-containing protein [Bacteroidota bacterium]
MEKIKAIIVDDEENNVKLLEHFVENYCSFVDVVRTVLTKEEAIRQIDVVEPQLIFLDIMLDSGTGFEVLEEATFKNYKVIFVTAFSDYAIKAFKYHAIDYILKPIDIEALVAAVNKAYKEIEKEQFTNEAQVTMLYNSMHNNLPLDFIAIPSLEKIEFIKFDEIIYFKSDGRYTEFYLLDGRKIVATKNLGEYESIVDGSMFFRTHKSYMVNLKHLKNINKAAGNYCEMVNGATLPIAKRRHESLQKLLGLR